MPINCFETSTYSVESKSYLQIDNGRLANTRAERRTFVLSSFFCVICMILIRRTSAVIIDTRRLSLCLSTW